MHPQLKFLTLLLPTLFHAALFAVEQPPSYRLAVPKPKLPFEPLSYLCHYTDSPIKIDGKLDDPAWLKAPWSSDYTDIEGKLRPVPALKTRHKILWNEDYLYFAVKLEEPHLWATLEERDCVIFHDNDWEIFLDPDGDTHNYYELEINAKNTVWDLVLTKPYRDGGAALTGWDTKGLKTAVHLNGSINDPSDTDRGWTIEVAIPFSALSELTSVACPPKPTDIWRINFSRVQWHLLPDDEALSRYSKQSRYGKPLPEQNWVWSPQGLIDMHYPERWGALCFVKNDLPAAEAALLRERVFLKQRESLFQFYYDVRNHQEKHGAQPISLDLSLKHTRAGISSEQTGYRFRASKRQQNRLLNIDDEGKFEHHPLP